MDLSFRSRRQLIKAKQFLPTQHLMDRVTAVKAWFQWLQVTILAFWHSLTTPQRCYFTATLLVIGLLWLDYEIEFSTLAWISWIIVAGLTIEFWPKFLHLWESLLGKTFILVFYAILANFALASSGGLVNEVTGVSADSLPYSHNWALVLMVPTWFLVTNLIALLVIQLLVPAYLVFLLLLKPFGIRGLWHSPEYKYVFSTALVRYVWVCILIAVMGVYGVKSGLVTQSSPIVGSLLEGFVHSHEMQQKEVKLAAVEEKNEIQTEDSGNTEASTLNTDENSNTSVPLDTSEKPIEALETQALITSTNSTLIEDEFIAELKKNQSDVKSLLKRSVANFIYLYEADSYSRCAHPEDTRVVELNDYELLIVKENKDADIGYDFNVIACHSPGVNPIKS